MRFGREPEVTVATERHSQQDIEREVEIREPQVPAREPSQEEPRAAQVEMPTGILPQTEEGLEEG